jgi:hypothetical protein
MLDWEQVDAKTWRAGDYEIRFVREPKRHQVTYKGRPLTHGLTCMSGARQAAFKHARANQ